MLLAVGVGPRMSALTAQHRSPTCLLDRRAELAFRRARCGRCNCVAYVIGGRACHAQPRRHRSQHTPLLRDQFAQQRWHTNPPLPRCVSLVSASPLSRSIFSAEIRHELGILSYKRLIRLRTVGEPPICCTTCLFTSIDLHRSPQHSPKTDAYPKHFGSIWT